MNRQFDIIIIGDSKAGHDTMKRLAAANTNIKIAFISCKFKSSTTHDFLNVEYIQDEVIFTDYKNQLFGCYLKKGARIYCTHLVFATGLAYEPYLINNEPVPSVFNTLDDIPKNAKYQPAVVIGTDESDIKFALNVAKKYKQVYICTKEIEIAMSTSVEKKLNNAENVIILPNTSVINASFSEGILNKVELDNYSTVTCSAIFIKTPTTPETYYVSDKLINKDENHYLETTSNLESTLVPKCFAVGNCVKKSTKKMILSMIEAILNDF